MLTGLCFFAILAIAMQNDLHELEKTFDQCIIEYNRLLYRLKNRKRHRLSAAQIEEIRQAFKKNEDTRLQILVTLTTALNTSLRKSQ